MTPYDRVVALVDAYTELYPDEEWGFAHIVLSDYNLLDSNINFCLHEWKLIDDQVRTPQTVAFLNFLLTIPEDDRIEPEE